MLFFLPLAFFYISFRCTKFDFVAIKLNLKTAMRLQAYMELATLWCTQGRHDQEPVFDWEPIK